MKNSARIRTISGDREALFEWLDFDGDDCFRDFHIDIVNGTETERFAFGNCAVWGLRQSFRFFQGLQDKAGFGFRFPDIRTYDLTRTGNGFLLQIRLEAAIRSEEYRFSNPMLILDDEFLTGYDADRT
jgi:hypothetical protein